MTDTHIRGERFFANRLQRELFYFVFCVCLVFIVVTAVSVHYVIYNIASDQLGVPQAIAYYVFPTAQRITVTLAVIAPLLLVMTLFFASQLTQRIVGPFDRIMRELDANLDGRRQGPIKVRKDDRFAPLVERINRLLEQKTNPQ